eukprot:CAMPEP_0197034820 /NCGR_PEP_ID=MMETSP1384-20130603/12784_1 /TAXON_ID=29189 /ORGANISM="Ammonia sp." /LENGTH=1016 /DNA_ID=CAMNT_0042464779 /DNA_START=25 /DNA_END=3075 /DNA_ORIENTATION=-
MAAGVDDKLQQHWQELKIQFQDLDCKSAENVPFQNSKLLDRLCDLPNDALLSPLSATDLCTTDSTQSSSQNTWQIEFNDDWQTCDQCGTFDSLCKKVHRSRDYNDLMYRLEANLEAWQHILKQKRLKCSWFRPPTFPSTLKMSFELKIPEAWSNYYKAMLAQKCTRKYSIQFKIKQLYSTYHESLIDAIYFAKCVNWDAAYDPKHSAKTSIPIYWIMAEIEFHFPSGMDANHRPLAYTANNVQMIPLSCFGLVNAKVNNIRDWFKLSPHFEPCRDLRARFQVNDTVEVFLWPKWVKGVIIDIVILNHNQAHTQEEDCEPIVEYLHIQTVDDAVCSYNRYDDRIRPLIQGEKMQSASLSASFSSKMLSKTDERDEKEQLLPPDVNIQQWVPPQYQLGTDGSVAIPNHLPTANHVNDSNDDEKIHGQAIAPQAQQHQPSRSRSPLSEDEEEKQEILETKEEEATNTHLDKQLFDDFDPRKHAHTMKQYQAELQQIMQRLQTLALHRTVVTDIFRPIHLTCPKHSYRTPLKDEQEVNMTVMQRNKQFDYVELRMIDFDDIELSNMKVYMTPQQLFQHSTTYFHFTDMQPLESDLDEAIVHDIDSRQAVAPQLHEDVNLHLASPLAPPSPFRADGGLKYRGSPIHEYLQSKHSSTHTSSVPSTSHGCSLPHSTSSAPTTHHSSAHTTHHSAIDPDDTCDHKEEAEADTSATSNPRSHLSDPTLQSILFNNSGTATQIGLSADWKNSNFTPSSKTFADALGDDVDGKQKSDIFCSTQQQQQQQRQQQEFIEKNWNPKPARSGLGAFTPVNEKALAMFPSWGQTETETSTQIMGKDVNNNDDEREAEEDKEEMPSTPKMASRSPSQNDSLSLQQIETLGMDVRESGDEEEENAADDIPQPQPHTYAQAENRAFTNDKARNSVPRNEEATERRTDDAEVKHNAFRDFEFQLLNEQEEQHEEEDVELDPFMQDVDEEIDDELEHIEAVVAQRECTLLPTSCNSLLVLLISILLFYYYQQVYMKR